MSPRPSPLAGEVSRLDVVRSVYSGSPLFPRRITGCSITVKVRKAAAVRKASRPPVWGVPLARGMWFLSLFSPETTPDRGFLFSLRRVRRVCSDPSANAGAVSLA